MRSASNTNNLPLDIAVVTQVEEDMLGQLKAVRLVHRYDDQNSVRGVGQQQVLQLEHVYQVNPHQLHFQPSSLRAGDQWRESDSLFHWRIWPRLFQRNFLIYIWWRKVSLRPHEIFTDALICINVVRWEKLRTDGRLADPLAAEHDHPVHGDLTPRPAWRGWSARPRTAGVPSRPSPRPSSATAVWRELSRPGLVKAGNKMKIILTPGLPWQVSTSSERSLYCYSWTCRRLPC